MRRIYSEKRGEPSAQKMGNQTGEIEAAGNQPEKRQRRENQTKVDTKIFYAKLAFQNIKKNKQTYIPYLLACMGTIMMYYIIRGLSMNQSMLSMRGGEQIRSLMDFGSWIIGIFAVIFLFYTNSFLIKRRKKEFGLYNILGMEKRHLGRVVLWESIYAFLASMTVGLGFGVLFSELVFLAVERALKLEMPLQFEVTPQAMAEALLLFGIIFAINLLNTLRQIHLANPVELLRGGNVGEKEPKTRWVIALLGFVTLGIGYYMAAMIENPVEALMFFFVAVILVIVATYCLFTAGSIAILKLMRRNKKFYYQPDHFISISGMMYRMKQNAAGLASICVLSTGVLILISTTICLYLGTEDAIRVRYPRNIYFNIKNAGEEVPEQLKEMTDKVLGNHGTERVDELNYFFDYYIAGKNENQFSALSDAQQKNLAADGVCVVQCLTLEDYNRLAGREVSLKENEVLVYGETGELTGGEILIGDTAFQVKEMLEEFPVSEDDIGATMDTYYLVLPGKDTSDDIAAALNRSGGKDEFVKFWEYWYSFDLDVEEEEQLRIWEELHEELKASGLDGSVRSAAEARSSFYGTNGGLFFLGIFLGFLFLMATVLIIYYKQISEGYDDRERYQIMQKVGMSRREVKGSIRSQVLAVFYLPLLVAGSHIFFAFNMIKRILYLMGLFNTQLFALCTVGTIIIFAVFYCLVYSRTAKAYYKIIS